MVDEWKVGVERQEGAAVQVRRSKAESDRLWEEEGGAKAAATAGSLSRKLSEEEKGRMVVKKTRRFR